MHLNKTVVYYCIAFSSSAMRSICLAFLFFLWIPTAFSFSDVNNSTRFQEEMDYIHSEGIVNGYPDGTYRPHQTINRYEFVKIIIGSVFPEETIQNCTILGNSFFPDASQNEWYSPYLCLAKNQEIIQGYGDGMFRGTNRVSLPEALKIVFDSFSINTSPYAGKEWYEKYMSMASEKGFLQPQGPIDNSLSYHITRGDMAWMITAMEKEKASKYMSEKNNTKETDQVRIMLTSSDTDFEGKVDVEYWHKRTGQRKTIYTFTYSKICNEKPCHSSAIPQYQIEYLSSKYLVIREFGIGVHFDRLFDLQNLERVELNFPGAGSIILSDNERYIFFLGIGRFMNPGIAIEVLDGNKIYCVLSYGDVEIVHITDKVLTFTEGVYRRNGEYAESKKNIPLLQKPIEDIPCINETTLKI